jgi:uncharacterized protein involved in cysteine biosynthesis
MNRRKKVRVNVSVDEDLLSKAKKKLDLFGGKVSSLFNAYLADFVESMDKGIDVGKKELSKKMIELEERIKEMEKKLRTKK